MEETLLGGVLFSGIILLAFIGFVIYFIFKQIEFVVKAINLYEKMIVRQDVMIKLLKDIRGTDGPDYEELLNKKGSSPNSEKGASVQKYYSGIGVITEPYGQKGIKVTGFPIISPAKDTGVEINDIIFEIDGILVDNSLESDQMLGGADGTKVNIKVSRNKEVKEFEIVRQKIINMTKR